MGKRYRQVVPLDDALDALGHVQRRRLLTLLVDEAPRRGPYSLEEVIRVACEEPGAGRLEFRHRHLPKLADYGFVRWDRERNEIAEGPRFEEIRPLVELLRDRRHELPRGWV